MLSAIHAMRKALVPDTPAVELEAGGLGDLPGGASIRVLFEDHVPHEPCRRPVRCEDERVAFEIRLGLPVVDHPQREAVDDDVLEDGEAVVGGGVGRPRDEGGEVRIGALGLRVEPERPSLELVRHPAILRPTAGIR